MHSKRFTVNTKSAANLNLMNLDISKYPNIQYIILCLKVWIFYLKNISKEWTKDKEKTKKIFCCKRLFSQFLKLALRFISKYIYKLNNKVTRLR